MPAKVLLISHDTTHRDDRASRWVKSQGYVPVWSCPAEGDPLPMLAEDVAGVIVYGGRYDIRDQEKHRFLTCEMKFVEATLQSDLPFLGLCLGGQLLAHVLGEEVGPHPEGYAEYGYYDLMPTPEGKSLFGEGLKVLQSHWHGWFAAPKGTVALGATQNFPQQAFRYGGKAFAFQFHPEATREMLQGWIARRPPGRHALPGTFLPERQLADNLVHDEALGKWFNAFLSDWLKSKDAQEAA